MDLKWFVLYVLIVDRIICRNIGPLYTTTTIVAAAASALFLPYYSFIDSRLSQLITIFLVSKWNGINENKESNNSCLVINNPSIYEWLIINGINNKKCAVCGIGYCKVGEKDGAMMIPVRWQWEVMIDMDRNDWMWICQIEHPLAILKDVVSVILVLVTLVSRSK